MAIISANGDERDLGNGITRRTIVLADTSTASTLVPAGTGKRRIVYAQLDLSAAGQVEIKTGSTGLYYHRLGGASILALAEDDLVQSSNATALSIESSVAMTCDGFVDYIDVA